MREIGGYIELDQHTGPMLHSKAIPLNCGRNALAYLIRAKKIKKIQIPQFLCSSVSEVCKKEGVQIKYYSVGSDFLPKEISLDPNEWLYLVNYYGQLFDTTIKLFVDQYKDVIVDNAQAYFGMPLDGVDTIYTCRKFFGVADGAFLYTDAVLDEELPRDESFSRMRFLMGRYERTASEFYNEYVENNRLFASEPIKKMSRLTENLLRGIDYKRVKMQRTENFKCLHDIFAPMNRLTLTVPDGAFMYPLLIRNGEIVRKRLQEKRIYVPILWADTLRCCLEEELEYEMAKNILPLPCDQRYNVHDMRYIAEEVLKCIN